MPLITTEFNLDAGLLTKGAEERTSGLVTAQNVDFFARAGAVGKVPGSSRQSNTASAAIDSIHYFEYFDSAGTFQRERLIFAGGTLSRVETDQTLTTLKTGLVAEPLTGVLFDNRLFLFSEGNTPIKYDGADVLNAGINAPGQTESSLDGFSDPSSYSISGSNTKAASTASQDGDGASVQVNKVDTGTTDASLTRSGVAYDLSSAPDDELRVYLNVPVGALGKLDSTTAIQIAFGEVGLGDSDVHSFGPGSLVEGWNLIVIDLTSPDSTNGSGATLSDVNEITYTIRLSSVSETQSGFLFDFLHTIDESSLTASVGSSGNVDEGDHSYRVVFVGRDGVLSNSGSSSNTVTAASGGSKINLTSIPTSSDDQVVARKIYRDNGGDAVYRLVATIEDNITTSATDNVSNASLSSQTAPQAATAIDNSPPPRMLTAVKYNGYMLGIDAFNRFQLNISDRNKPHAWPTNAPIVFDKQLTAIVPLIDSALLFGADSIIRIDGGDDGISSIRFQEVNPEIGCLGFRAADRVKNTLVWIYEDDWYLASSAGVDPWSIVSQIRDEIDALPHEELQDAHVLHDKTRSRVLFFVRSTSGGKFDQCFVYSYGQLGSGIVSSEGQGIDSQDLRIGKWSKLIFPTSYDIRCSAIIERSADTREVWIGDAEGIVYRLQDPDETTWADGSATEEIEAVIETTSEQINPASFEARCWPRYATLSGTSSTQSTWTLEITTQEHVEGPAITTKEYTITVGPGATSRRIALSKQQGVAVKAKLTNTSGGGGVLRSLRIDSIARQARGLR